MPGSMVWMRSGAIFRMRRVSFLGLSCAWRSTRGEELRLVALLRRLARHAPVERQRAARRAAHAAHGLGGEALRVRQARGRAPAGLGLHGGELAGRGDDAGDALVEKAQRAERHAAGRRGAPALEEDELRAAAADVHQQPLLAGHGAHRAAVVEHGLLIAGEHADVETRLLAHALDDLFPVGDVAQRGRREGEGLAVRQQVDRVAELAHDLDQPVYALRGHQAVLADVGRQSGRVLVVQYGRDAVAVHAVYNQAYRVGANVYNAVQVHPSFITLHT